jgi:hypothetical protein
MDKVIEQLRKEAQPIVPNCIGRQLPDGMVHLLDPKHPVCSRIDPVEIFEIIDEETGAVDEEAGPEISSVDEACRCTAYAFPEAKWKNGKCPLATHILHEEETRGKVRVGQQKQKKR